MCSENDTYTLLPCKKFGKAHQMPPEFSKIEERIKNLKIRNDDIFVIGYPKSGTSWLAELVWLIQNDYNFEKAKEIQDYRIHILEGESVWTCFRDFYLNNYETKHLAPKVLGEGFHDLLEFIDNMPNTRVLKTHLPWDLLPMQIVNGERFPKIIHVMRNPKQVVVSYYYHSMHFFPSFKGSLNDFVDAFTKGKLIFGDYFNTNLSCWQQRNRPNVLNVTYEEMHQNLDGIIKRVADFLGKTCTHQNLIMLKEYLSFEQMRNNEAINRKLFIWDQSSYFMREGSVDGYKNELSPENIKVLDKWIEKNAKGTGLPYEI